MNYYVFSYWLIGAIMTFWTTYKNGYDCVTKDTPTLDICYLIFYSYLVLPWFWPIIVIISLLLGDED